MLYQGTVPVAKILPPLVIVRLSPESKFNAELGLVIAHACRIFCIQLGKQGVGLMQRHLLAVFQVGAFTPNNRDNRLRCRIKGGLLFRLGNGKTVLRNEARNYHRDMKRQRDRETSFSVLPQAELDKLYTVDHYPSDDFVFSSHGYDLHIDNELVAAAFAELPQQAQSILILHCVLEMADGEIGALMGMSRSAVQRHRTKTLKELRTKLMALMPEGG